MLNAAAVNAGLAVKGMEEIYAIGCTEPVPAVLLQLRAATSAVIELERRARGGEPVKEG